MKSTVDIKKLKKQSKEFKKFLKYCECGEFYKETEKYLSETQISSRISDKARELRKKLGLEDE